MRRKQSEVAAVVLLLALRLGFGWAGECQAAEGGADISGSRFRLQAAPRSDRSKTPFLTKRVAERTTRQTNAAAGGLDDNAQFDPRHLLEVQIQMAPADWDALRHEHHDLLAALGPTRFDQREPKPYRTYEADVTIDGVVLGRVGIHKRGFLGSASSQRPSLGITFDEFDPRKQFGGQERMSLNNNRQDPSRLHQVLAARIFAAAGVPTPRCNLACVTVNGKCLGIYSHIEAVRRPFLERHFGDGRGNLYEGQLSDFRPDWVKTFEKKNNREAGRDDLAAMMKALQSEDANLLGNLEPLLDLDAYLSFWAVEGLIGHWDSYSNNGNNFFIYRVPASGRFQFIPWGADSVFGDRDPFTPFEMPESVMARSILPYRLYRLSATRERYRARLRELLRTVWNERDLLADVDRLEALVEARIAISSAHFRDGLERLRQFIRSRRAALLPELDGPAPEWNIPLKAGACLTQCGTLRADFTTTWLNSMPLNPLTNGTLNLELVIDGKTQTFAMTGANAAPARDPRNDGCPTLSLIGVRRGSLKVEVLALVVQPEFYLPGTALKIDAFSVGSVLLEGTLLGGKFQIAGVPLGIFKLKEAGLHPGEKVSGTLAAEIYRMPR